MRLAHTHCDAKFVICNMPIESTLQEKKYNNLNIL